MKISAKANGPLLMEVSSAMLIKNGQEKELNAKMIALCRCGHSQNKPFCDGSHKKEQFKAEPCEIILR